MKVQEELGRVGPYLDRLCLLPETGTVLLPPSLGRRLSRGAGALTRREAPSCLPTPSGGVSAPGALTSAGALALSQVAGSITAVGGRPDGESPKALRQSELSARQRGRRQRELEERAALRELRSAPTPRRSRVSRTNWRLSRLLRQ